MFAALGEHAYSNRSAERCQVVNVDEALLKSLRDRSSCEPQPKYMGYFRRRLMMQYTSAYVVDVDVDPIDVLV